jgi:hypothetical protein
VSFSSGTFLRIALEKYCNLDTKGMIDIVELLSVKTDSMRMGISLPGKELVT